MKFSALSLLALTGPAAAWWGQVYTQYQGGNEGGGIFWVYLTDYDTGSTYTGELFGNINQSGQELGFVETSPGGYNWNAAIWQTSDGCFNIDFQGAFGAGHGFCCGNPCDLGA